MSSPWTFTSRLCDTMPAMNSKNFNRRDFFRLGFSGLAGVGASTSVAARSVAGRSVAAEPLVSLRRKEESLSAVEAKHPVVHFEIGCRDAAATKDFYQKMFDWTIDSQLEIADAGLPGHIVSLGHEPYHYTTFYVQVEDVAKAIAKAESLGGKKVVGPVNIPFGTFAWIRDTQENMIGLWKPK